MFTTFPSRSIFPHYSNTNLIHTHIFSTLLQEGTHCDYLRLRLDPKKAAVASMKAAVASILEKANKGHSLALAVSYSLRYDKHHCNPTLCSSPVEMLNLWKSCVLPHFLLYLRYISAASQVQTLQATLNRSLTQHHTACLWAPHSITC